MTSSFTLSFIVEKINSRWKYLKWGNVMSKFNIYLIPYKVAKFEKLNNKI